MGRRRPGRLDAQRGVCSEVDGHVLSQCTSSPPSSSAQRECCKPVWCGGPAVGQTHSEDYSESPCGSRYTSPSRLEHHGDGTWTPTSALLSRQQSSRHNSTMEDVALLALGSADSLGDLSSNRAGTTSGASRYHGYVTQRSVSMFYPDHASECENGDTEAGVDFACERNRDLAHICVEGYFANDVGVVIPRDLPRSTVLYVLTASDGRDMLFKVLQYSLQLVTCLLNEPALFSDATQVCAGRWAERFWANCNTIRHGRCLFKVGRGLLNLMTLQTVCERLWLVHGQDIRAFTCRLLPRAKWANPLARLLREEPRSSAQHPGVGTGRLHHYPNAIVNTSSESPRRRYPYAPAEESADDVFTFISPVEQRRAADCRICVSTGLHRGPASQFRDSAKQSACVSPVTSEPPPDKQKSLSGGEGLGSNQDQLPTDEDSRRTVRRGTLPCNEVFDLPSLSTSPPDQVATLPVSPMAKLGGLSGAQGDRDGIDTIALCQPDVTYVTTNNAAHVERALKAVTEGTSLDRKRSGEQEDLAQRSQDESDVTLTSSSSFIEVTARGSFRSAASAAPACWRKGHRQFCTTLMLLLGFRSAAAACRRFLRDLLLFASEQFFRLNGVIDRRPALHRVVNRLWLFVAVIDLFLNSVRLAQPGWYQYAAARYDARLRCACPDAEGPRDAVLRMCGVCARPESNVIFPALDLDYGAPTASTINFFEAADPKHMQPACCRCGFLYNEPPSYIAVAEAGQCTNPAVESDGALKGTDVMHASGLQSTRTPPPSKEQDGSPAGRADGACDKADDYFCTSVGGEAPVRVLLLPWCLRKCFNMVWMLSAHRNWTSTVLLEVHYLMQLYIAYKYCYGGYETGLRDAPLANVLHPWGAIAGLVSASVGLLRVVESAPK